ncbi:MSHA biogenesis protein MshI [Enterovibrio nigricans]|uniref:MSHA biogenesis protein MshI n=1 Tax=Enterovibrio nigricans DSM 22720 TaxID=1121868 RepID=A0A1T4TVU8_9GAMM|nr:MSHA biogenesis protein MshI [Enterovibrio nigricans]PKF50808.1 MSHA biogenesis protein MshI [Enterovibrio nigricans]SKA44577.1 MSHA biogenesis protein MshI [Enterovibrio nigricans DSM 22720]
MAVSTFLARINPSRQQNVVSVYISVQRVVISSDSADIFRSESLSPGTEPWGAALKLLHALNINHADINLILGHGLYQTLLIDDPGLSDEDKRAALPFQIKDFIAESPSDVLADGYASPIAGRFHVFVCNRNALVHFYAQLKKSHCQPSLVTVEDVVLRQWTKLDKTEMVLSRDSQGAIQLAVFDKGKLCFQRQIRGLVLDGNTLQPLVIDDLALEIQRSLDYLRPQLKASQVSGLVVSVENVDDTELAFQLSSRLMVSVRPQSLFEEGAHYQHIVQAGHHASCSPDLNFFSKGLIPKAPWLTFEKMLFCWGATAFMLVLVAAYQQLQLSQTTEIVALSNIELETAQTLSSQLDSQLKLHVPSLAIENDISEAEKRLAAKKSVLAAVKQHDIASQEGYSQAFNALASLSRHDVSVSDIYIGQDTLDVKGVVATPESVPSWLKTFQTQEALAHFNFKEMSLGRDEHDRITFSLLSKRTAEEATK